MEPSGAADRVGRQTDRRHIREKIDKLKEDLAQVMRTRDTQRRRREKNGVPLVTIVGYTNAGKSTLLNKLTDAGIQANDRLFDTLDPTTRVLKLDSGREVLISDTVGFIRKLPHMLVNAFKATLEELSYADLIIHVIDASNPEWRKQAEVTRGLIRELCAEGVPIINVFNKEDLCAEQVFTGFSDAVWISAKHGNGIERLIQMIEKRLGAGRSRMELLLPYDRAGVLDSLYKDAEVESAEYTDAGIAVIAVCDGQLCGKYEEFALKPQTEL